MPEANEPRIISSEFLGDYIREHREKAGFRSREQFLHAIKERTGIEISSDTIKRIETGKTLPKLEVFLAIAMTLTNATTFMNGWSCFVADALAQSKDGHIELTDIAIALPMEQIGLMSKKEKLAKELDNWSLPIPPQEMAQKILNEAISQKEAFKERLDRITYTSEDRELMAQALDRLKQYEQDISEFKEWKDFFFLAKPAQ